MIVFAKEVQGQQREGRESGERKRREKEIEGSKREKRAVAIGDYK